MSMETKTDPSASASTTGSLGSDPTDPAVVALMDRLQSRDAKDHASFIMTLYGTDTPGGKAFADELQPGLKQRFHNRTLSRKTVNDALESSCFGHGGVSFGTEYASSLLGKLHTDQEGVPESIQSWGPMSKLDLMSVFKDAFENEYMAYLGPEELCNWPLLEEEKHAEMTWKTAFNLLSPHEPTDILEPGEFLPAPPPRYMWRGSYERVDNIGKAMHDAIDSALRGPELIPGGNTWGKRTIYRLEPSDDTDTERAFENCLSKESQQFLDRVEKSTDLCDLVLSAFDIEPGSEYRVTDIRQELNEQLVRKVYENSSNLKQATGKADKTFVGNISTGLHGLSSYLFEIVDGVVRKQYDVKHGEANMYSVVPSSLRGLIGDGPTLAKMRWDRTFNVLSSQHQELESELSDSPPTWDGRNVLLVYPASQPPSGRHQTAFSILQTAIKKAREGPKPASQVSKEELAQSDRQWCDEYNRSTAMTSSRVDTQSTPSKSPAPENGKGALRSLFSRR